MIFIFKSFKFKLCLNQTEACNDDYTKALDEASSIGLCFYLCMYAYAESWYVFKIMFRIISHVIGCIVGLLRAPMTLSQPKS